MMSSRIWSSILLMNLVHLGQGLLEKQNLGRSIPFQANERQFYYVNITIPNNRVHATCAHCNVERCRPIQYCYSILYSSTDRSVGDYCADENEMFSLVGAQLDATTSSHGKRRKLKRRQIHEKCLKSINDDNLSYCVCDTIRDATTSREYEDLRKIRIWRYQSLVVHNELMNSEAEKKNLGLLLLSAIFWLARYIGSC